MTASRFPSPGRGRTARLCAWCDDHLNPLLVRTMRQEMRSRVFVIVYQLVLLAAAMVALLTCWLPAGQDGPMNGEPLFTVIVIAWSVVSWMVVPVSVAQGMIRESSEDTWNLVEITGMRPRKAVLGLMASALARGLWVGMALLPFLGLAYLLRGVDISLLLTAVIFIPVFSLVLSAWAALVVSLSFKQNALRQGISGLIFLACTLITLYSIPTWIFRGEEIVADLFHGRAPAEMVVMLFTAANVALLLVAAPVVLASAALAHTADNRSTAPRLLTWIVTANIFALLAVVSLAYSGMYGRSFIDHWLRDSQQLMCCALVIVAALAFFAVSESTQLSQRQLRSVQGPLPKWSFMLLFGPGGGRGKCCAVLLSLLVAGVAIINLTHSQASAMTTNILGAQYGFLAGVSMVLLWLAVVDTLTSFLSHRPLHRRIAAFVTLAAWGLLVPLIGVIVTPFNHSAEPWFWWSPFFGSFLLGEAVANESPGAWGAFLTQIIMGLTAVLILLGRGIWEMQPRLMASPQGP